MTRLDLAVYLTDTYSVAGEYLFARYPSFQVFRHNGNRKWFAVIMDIPGKNLGLPGEGEISVVNLKCDSRLIGFFREEPGIFPGWHMNKAHWITVALDGSVEDEKVSFLVDMSYELTKKEEVGDHFLICFMYYLRFPIYGFTNPVIIRNIPYPLNNAARPMPFPMAFAALLTLS